MPGFPVKPPETREVIGGELLDQCQKGSGIRDILDSTGDILMLSSFSWAASPWTQTRECVVLRLKETQSLWKDWDLLRYTNRWWVWKAKGARRELKLHQAANALAHQHQVSTGRYREADEQQLLQ